MIFPLAGGKPAAGAHTDAFLRINAMAKRTKHHSDLNKSEHRGAPSGSPAAAAAHVAHPPAKNPSLLAASIVLFMLWFAFLLVAALWG
jgi:hypothetical protein